jgi:uncharacterized protein YbjT (DUF2867 family)
MNNQKETKKETVLVVGSSGTVGAEIVKLLKAQGVSVRAATSQKEKAGDEGKVYLNLVTGEGIKQALSEVDKAFFLSPPGHADQYSVLSPLIQEAKRQGLKKVVLMTALGANASDTTPFRKAEIELEKSGLNYNIIRPNWFFQNFNTFWVQGIREQNKILVLAGTAKVSFIDARDIAAVAVKLLGDDSISNQAFDLTGPAAVDHGEVAAQISKTIGKKTVYKEIQPQELKAGLLSGGVPIDYAEFLLMIFGFLREGYNAGLNSNVKKLLGREPMSLAQYASDYKKSWI